MCTYKMSHFHVNEIYHFMLMYSLYIYTHIHTNTLTYKHTHTHMHACTHIHTQTNHPDLPPDEELFAMECNDRKKQIEGKVCICDSLREKGPLCAKIDF